MSVPPDPETLAAGDETEVIDLSRVTDITVTREGYKRLYGFERERAETAEAALVEVQKEMAAVHALSYRCQAWVSDAGQCPNRATMLLQFTGAIHIRVDVCEGCYMAEYEYRQGEL